MTTASPANSCDGLESSAQQLRDAHYQRIVVRCDHLFAVLFVIQWIACVLLAWVITPYTWEGEQQRIHPHIWAALILGGIITSFPMFLILTRPGMTLTRHVVAAAQMLFSALLIHVSGGRIETHFHIFGSLAFLAFYRDWRVLLTATVVTALDHFLRGMFWPQSIFGVAAVSQWRWLEHAGWVIFEDIFLVIACIQGQTEMTEIIRTAQRQEAADRANAAKSEFLARMSHEIRSPLNGVVGMLDLLRTTELSESQQRYARLSREAADSLLNVINDILDFSKIEAGKVELEAIEFDLPRLIEDLIELIGPMAQKKKLALGSIIRPDIPRCSIGDPNRIRQVLTNLLNNAMKFTQAGSVSVWASLERQDADYSIVRIEVQDTGVGIPNERMDRLFQSFSQVDTSTTRKFGGTGLGLAISKFLAELMGGEIGVESELGRGTTFWFTLKLAVAKTTSPSAFGLADKLHSVRLLAVEEDICTRNFLVAQLDGRLSPECAVVGPDAAIEVLRQAYERGRPFDVAMIPFGSQDQSILARTIQADMQLRGTVLIAVAPIEDNTEVAQVKRAGFFDLLHRPLTQSHIFDVITTSVVQRAEPKSESPRMKTPSDLPKGLHLLVAEDNEMNQFVTEEILRQGGCTCEVVGDGALAVEAVKKGKYAAILMDCQMPNLDGLNASQQIRAWEQQTGTARLPIIALTADALQGDREKCLAAGMDGYVTKPINARELFAALGSVLVSNKPSSPSTELLTEIQNSADIPIDVQALFNRCLNDVEFTTKMLEKFYLRANGDVDLMRHAFDAGDIKSATRLAHNFKAIAAHTGAENLRKIAFEIEQAGIGNELDLIQKQLDELAAEAKRCAEFVPNAIAQASKLSQSKKAVAPGANP